MSLELTNIEAERGVLARILVNDREWYDIADRLSRKDFSDRRHMAIFDGMSKLVAAGRPVARPLLLSQVKEGDNEIELSAYLAGLAAAAPRSEELPALVDAVLHAAGRRRILSALDTVRDEVERAGLDTPLESLVLGACRQIEASDTDSPDACEPLLSIVSGAVSDLNDVFTNGRVVGYRTGLRAFDDLVGTLLDGNLIVLGGETSSGKTALAFELAVLLAQSGVPTHFSSLEMTKRELGYRFLSRWSDIPASKLVDGHVNASELDHVFRMGERADLPLYIDDGTNQTTSTLRARIARAKARRGVQVAVIDHLQYVTPDPARDERVQIKQVVDDAKAIAKQLAIPVILISHVSRLGDSGAIQCAADIRRPLLRDLYGSSAIEKAADVVLFVHRPIWFLDRVSSGRRSEELEADRLRWAGKAEFVLAKRRGGKGTGVRECWFDEQLTWFHDSNPAVERGLEDEGVPF